MQNELQIFNNEEFGKIRTLEIEGKPYFVANDIAKALGYKDTTKAVKQHCRWVAKRHIPHPQSKDKELEVNIIPEGDMYRLITNSELPSAERFESWVFDEVLPSLRKTGTYTINTSYQYPVSPAALESATNAGRLFERIMRNEGSCPYEIAMVVRTLFQQAGIDVPEFVVKIPAYEQLALDIVTR